MDPVIHELLRERIAASRLDAEAQHVIELAADAGGPPATTARRPVWLRSVTVEGFRGIGAPATLQLEPSPGLTVVVGRNGSGKSSFAEGLELLMTGALKRWEKRPKAWTETWQCLHHAGPTRLQAELVLEGSGETVTLTQEWPPGANYDDASGRAAPAAILDEHGWARDLPSFRPFLSYAELATMFDTLSSLYDALTPVLGLGDVDELIAKLGAARLQYDNQRKAAAATREQLKAGLDPEDERAALVAGILGARKPDLDALAALLEEAPDYSGDTAQLRRLATLALPTDEEIEAAFTALAVAERAHSDAAATDATRATNIATLLRQALAVREGEDCPVCNTPGVLDDAWATNAADHAAALEAQAATLTRARNDLAATRRRVDGLLAAPEPLETKELALAEAARQRSASAQARAELNRRDSAWQDLVARLKPWLAEAREIDQRAATLKALKDAEKWVKETAQDLRAERFAPISERAIANWRELRQGSSVDLHEITLKKVGRGGRADFDVRADGDAANALGVMSQGELLALSVSVFLPRAALDESPFRFAVIDDPVQAMDPAKVDGLARVLHHAARTRQLVVFTHDDRLPEAIRRLRLDAVMLHVDRRARSTVDVQVSRSPINRYLDGARKYARAGSLPPEVQARIVPMFCRSAVEAAAASIVRRRAASTGTSLELADEQLEEARTLRELLALALFGEAGRSGDVATEIRHRHGAPAATLVAELNRGAHGQLDASTLSRLPEETRELIHALTR